MNPYYIDVRTPEEFETGHYPTAINHPLDRLEQGIFPDISKDTPIMVYCRSGGRSTVAEQLLTQAGFTEVTNAGGLADILSS